ERLKVECKKFEQESRKPENSSLVHGFLVSCSSGYFVLGWVPLLLDPALREGVARDDFRDETLHTVALFGDIFHQAIYHDFVVALELAAERVGQQFLRQVAAELGFFFSDNHFQFSRRRKTFSPRQLTGG